MCSGYHVAQHHAAAGTRVHSDGQIRTNRLEAASEGRYIGRESPRSSPVALAFSMTDFAESVLCGHSHNNPQTKRPHVLPVPDSASVQALLCEVKLAVPKQSFISVYLKEDPLDVWPSVMGLGNEVRYIQDQGDSIRASPPTARNNPFYLTWQDIRTLISLFHLLPKLFLPFRTTNPTDELYTKGHNLRSMLFSGAVSCLEILCFPLVTTLVLVAPGAVGLLILVLVIFLISGICAPIQGPRIIHSVPDEAGGGVVSRAGETWVFINGILVTGFSFKQNCDRLSRIFGRHITGIHNRTYGLLGDLVECIAQRSFSYHTYDVRVAYDHVRDVLVDPSVRKVVLIGHSQGTIVIAMILDMLFANLASSDMAKVEVYTFGSAASHFNNPHRQKASVATNSGVIKHIEHYVNGEDLVPRWGVLSNEPSASQKRYAGKVFVRKGATGHMLNQHYLSQMFPLRDHRPSRFLDQEVLVETGSDGEDLVRQESPAQSGACLAIGQEIPAMALEQSENTVRELSRLWRYMGGKDPDENIEV